MSDIRITSYASLEQVSSEDYMVPEDSFELFGANASKIKEAGIGDDGCSEGFYVTDHKVYVYLFADKYLLDSLKPEPGSFFVCVFGEDGITDELKSITSHEDFDSAWEAFQNTVSEEL